MNVITCLMHSVDALTCPQENLLSIRHKPPNCVDERIITDHIFSFNPQVRTIDVNMRHATDTCLL